MTILDIATHTRDTQIGPEQSQQILAQTWGTPCGIWGALTTVDHKVIGLRYIITAFVFLALGGVLAMLMRLQLATPEARVLSADVYNQVFTVIGSNMMFQGRGRKWPRFYSPLVSHGATHDAAD
jgi:cytochrome c oxidase subunit I+III